MLKKMTNKSKKTKYNTDSRDYSERVESLACKMTGVEKIGQLRCACGED